MSLRTYGQMPLSIWYLEFKKILRVDPEGGRASILLYTYLRSAPGSNAVGLYCKSVGVIADESSLSKDEVLHGLKTLEELGLAFHDPESCTVWVPAVSDELVPKSGRFAAGSNMLEAIRTTLEAMSRQESPFVEPIIRRYARAFHLEDLLESPQGAVSPPLESPQGAVAPPLDHSEKAEPETETKTETKMDVWMDLEAELARVERHGKALPKPFARYGNGPVVGAVAGVGAGAGAGAGAGRAPARAASAQMSLLPPPWEQQGSEPAAPTDENAVFGWLECRPDKRHPDGRRWAVSEAKICEWKRSYPTIDVDGLVRDLIQWSLDKKHQAPSRMPTHGGAARFFANAFKRQETQGGDRVLKFQHRRSRRRAI